MLSFDITSDDAPYVGYSVSGDNSDAYPFSQRFGRWTLVGQDPIEPHCMTLTATHVLTGETTDQQVCTDDPSIASSPCMWDGERGCSSSGSTPALPLAIALCFLLAFAATRRWASAR